MLSGPSADLAAQVLLNQELRAPLLDAVLPFFSLRAPLFVLFAALLVWRASVRGKGQAAYFIVLVLAMGASDLSCNVAKHAVGRLRPLHSIAGTHYQESGQWRRLPADYTPDRERDTSFPSAHAANTAALTLLAALFWRRLRSWIWALPVLVGWSRIYLGKHFPLDILGGWILGLGIGLGVWMLWRRAAPRLRLAVLPDELYRPCLREPS